MTLDFFSRFSENVARLPDHVVFQILDDQGRDTFTYRRIDDELNRVSRFLLEAGLEPGQTVGILMENHPRWGIAYLAAQSAGAIVVPFDILHSVATLVHLVDHAQCRFLMTSQEQAPKTAEVLARLDRDIPVLATGAPREGWSSWDEVIEREWEGPARLPLVERGLDEPLSIMYTSGTTGDPKGVVLSGRALYRNVIEVLKRIDLTTEDHFLCVLPLYHALALMANFVVPLYTGTRVTYMPVLDPQRILKAFREEEITIFMAVPQFFNLVHRRIFQEISSKSAPKRWLFRRLLALSSFSIRRLGLNLGRTLFKPVHAPFGSRFRLFGVGGARFDPQIARDFRDLGFLVVQAYGMTETAAVATITPMDKTGGASVGSPLPHAHIRIDGPDEDGIGEVLIGGESIMQGYWRNPEASQEVLDDGWLRSGDLGYLDSAGMLHITGRSKDVIVLSSGKNIFPEELEQHYSSESEFIKEICIVGVEDETSDQGQEKLHAVIVPDFDVLKRKQIVNAADTIRYFLDNRTTSLPSYKKVRSFEIRTKPLPRTTTRKIKRHEVLANLNRADPGDRDAGPEDADQPAASAADEAVFELIRQAKKAPVLHRESNLELDIGFDSLERVEFMANLQQVLKIDISDDDAARILTVGDLVDLVDRLQSGEVSAPGEKQLSWSEMLRQPLSEEDSQLVARYLSSKPVGELALYIATRLVFLAARIFFSLKVTGREHLPRDNRFLICPNHLSFFDAPFVAAALPYRVLKKCFFLGEAGYFSGPIISRLARWIKLVPVNPDRHLRQALRMGGEGLRRGKVLMVFPEGERSVTGQPLRFRKGPAILSQALQAPVVPVGIRGAFQAWPRGGKIRRHPIRIHFGPPLDPPADPGGIEDFNRRLRDEVGRLTHGQKPDRQ